MSTEPEDEWSGADGARGFVVTKDGAYVLDRSSTADIDGKKVLLASGVSGVAGRWIRSDNLKVYSARTMFQIQEPSPVSRFRRGLRFGSR